MISRLSLSRLPYATMKNLLLQNKGIRVRETIIRKSHNECLYRKAPPLYKESKLSLFVSSLFWWWIIWHCLVDYHVFLGHKYPDPSKWTNEELGIPED